MRILAIVLLTASGLAAADPVTDILDSDDAADDAVVTLRGFVAHTPASTDRAVIANVKLGEALRRRACPVPLVDGLCVELVPVRGRTAQCDANPHARVIARDPKLAGEASAAFQRAIKEADDHPTAVGERARSYASRARLGEVDHELDAYLARTLPFLDFDPRHPAIAASSKTQLRAWFEGRELAGAALATRYQALVAAGDPATAITARARLAQIPASFANALVTAPIPAAIVRGGDPAIEAYCDATLALVDPLETAAVERFAACFRESQALGWFTASSEACERELAKRKPETWPVLTELHPAPGESARITEIAPPR